MTVKWSEIKRQKGVPDPLGWHMHVGPVEVNAAGLHSVVTVKYAGPHEGHADEAFPEGETFGDFHTEPWPGTYESK